MANERRIRNDNVQGTVAVAITSTSATLRSANLANLEAISSTEHAAIIIDPGRTAGAPEIVHVTAHTASSTSATISRAKEGTSARAHSSTERWVHAPTATKDYVAMAPPTCRVRRDATHLLPTGAWDTIPFDTEDWDTNTMWSSTNADQVFVRTAGKYLATFAGGIKESTVGTLRGAAIVKTSTALVGTNDTYHVLASQDMLSVCPRFAVSGIFSMTTSDYLTAQMFQDSGGDLGTSTEVSHHPRLAVLWVST